MQKFGFTRSNRGVTMHGLRHGRLQAVYEDISGVPAPVCGGGSDARAAQDRAARLAVSQMAGHARLRAASAYLGSSALMRSKALKPIDSPAEQGRSDCA
jgi:hypothetical protein